MKAITNAFAICTLPSAGTMPLQKFFPPPVVTCQRHFSYSTTEAPE